MTDIGQLPEWALEIQTSLTANTQFVLSGNIRDDFALPATADGDPPHSVQLSITELIWRLLRSRGYEFLLIHDPMDGLRSYPDEISVSAIQRHLAADITHEPRSVALDELRGWLHNVVHAGCRGAVLLDYASRLIRDPQALSDEEFRFFAFAEKLSRTDWRPPAEESGTDLYNPVIWLTTRHQDLPSWLTAGNARVRRVSVPTPNRHQRLKTAETILGANGAGKTTTLRAVSGMIQTTGSIKLRGEELIGQKAADIVRHGVAHVPQGRGTLPELSVEDNLRVGAYVRKDKEVEADMKRWFEIYPVLHDRRTQRAGSLSGGEQQMLAVSRALMSRPSLLLLDEPSLGLAPIIVQDLFARFHQINQETGTTILVVEQNATLALGIATRGYVLEAGTIAVEGAADQLIHDDNIRKAYLGV